MFLLRSRTEKQQPSDTLAGMEGYLVLSAAKRHYVKEGSSREVAPAIHVLLSRHCGCLLPNMPDKTAGYVVSHPFICLRCYAQQ